MPPPPPVPAFLAAFKTSLAVTPRFMHREVSTWVNILRHSQRFTFDETEGVPVEVVCGEKRYKEIERVGGKHRDN